MLNSEYQGKANDMITHDKEQGKKCLVGKEGKYVELKLMLLQTIM